MWLVALTLPAGASAQATTDSSAAPRAAVFAYLQYGDTVGIEAVRSDSSLARGVYLIPKQGRIAWDHWLVAGTPTTLVLSVYPLDDGGVLPLRETEYALTGDSMVVIARDERSTEREAVGTVADAIPAFGRSMTHLAYLAFYAVQARRPSLPLFLTSSGKTVTATVQVTGESLIITVDGLRIESHWDEGALTEIRVPSQGLVVRRVPAAAS